MEPILAELAAAYQRATEHADQLRTELHATILEELARGTKQADIARVTGYTRERLRQIAKAAE
jgi:hypothetical protein